MSNRDEQKRILACEKTRPFVQYYKSLKVALKDFVWLLTLLFVAILALIGMAWIATYLQGEHSVHDAPIVPEARGLASDVNHYFDQGPIIEFELICPGNDAEDYTEVQDPIA